MKGDHAEYLAVCLVTMTLVRPIPFGDGQYSAKCCYKGSSCLVGAAIIYFGTKEYAFLPLYDLSFRARCN